MKSKTEVIIHIDPLAEIPAYATYFGTLGTFYGRDPTPKPTPALDAIAALYLAAPALQHALELLVNCASRVIGQDSPGQDMVRLRAAAIEHARAVLARSKGEPQP